MHLRALMRLIARLLTPKVRLERTRGGRPIVQVGAEWFSIREWLRMGRDGPPGEVARA